MDLQQHKKIFSIAKIGYDEETNQQLNDIKGFVQVFLDYQTEELEKTDSMAFFFPWLSKNENIREDEVQNKEKLKFQKTDDDHYVRFMNFVS